MLPKKQKQIQNGALTSENMGSFLAKSTTRVMAGVMILVNSLKASKSTLSPSDVGATGDCPISSGCRHRQNNIGFIYLTGKHKSSFCCKQPNAFRLRNTHEWICSCVKWGACVGSGFAVMYADSLGKTIAFGILRVD